MASPPSLVPGARTRGSVTLTRLTILTTSVMWVPSLEKQHQLGRGQRGRRSHASRQETEMTGHILAGK